MPGSVVAPAFDPCSEDSVELLTARKSTQKPGKGLTANNFATRKARN